MKTRTNEEWLRALRSQGVEQREALDDLRESLLRAALYFFHKSRANLPEMTIPQIQQIAEDLAQESLIEILAQLDGFRGESKFTTWVFRFVINKALVELRRYQGKTLSLEDLVDRIETPDLSFADTKTVTPERAAQRDEVWRLLREIIQTELTERQRQILRAVVFDDVPIDQVAQLLEMNRNAVYKMLHDARLKLKKTLEARGYEVGEILEIFELPH